MISKKPLAASESPTIEVEQPSCSSSGSCSGSSSKTNDSENKRARKLLLLQEQLAGILKEEVELDPQPTARAGVAGDTAAVPPNGRVASCISPSTSALPSVQVAGVPNKEVELDPQLTARAGVAGDTAAVPPNGRVASCISPSTSALPPAATHLPSPIPGPTANSTVPTTSGTHKSLPQQLENAPFSQSLMKARDELVEMLKLQCAEDNWKRLDQNSASELQKLNAIFSENGLSITKYLTGECWLELTGNTVAFTKLFLALINHGLCFANSDMVFILDGILFDVLSVQLKHYSSSLKSDKLSQERSLIMKNASFLLECVVPVCEELFYKQLREPSFTLPQIRQEFSSLLVETDN